ncbi:MAG: isoprenylcysteine carboxylmethyltransferase family protein [Syntrophobacteraceae bacterium]
MRIPWAAHGSKTRIIHTRLLAAGILALVLTSGNMIEDNLIDGFLKFAGVACVVISAFGRIWTSVYISGYKTGSLIVCGPYSATRNPLYLFSLIGAAGVGLASGSLLILLLFVFLFALYYPSVIRQEEKNLEERHGTEFQAYMERVPRFWPKISLYSQPETYVVNTKQLQRALIDASYFIWIYGGLELLQRLREAGILPAFFRIP